MINAYFYFYLVLSGCLLATFPSVTAAPNESRTRMIYNSLDPLSVSQHLAFYELYAPYPIGQQALQDAWRLLSQSNRIPLAHLNENPFSASTITALVALVNKTADQELTPLNEEDLFHIERLSARLPHTKLRGHWVTKEEDVLRLPPQEIDLARGLFLSQFGTDQQKVRTYEALIDLMALQILARLPDNASPSIKIRLINRFIFEEMGFRFPPHSLYAKDIDVYTFLPSVLDSHRGVCLGVSILYLCLAQRLDLPLEMITPPGHIYVRYNGPEGLINIETTARGVHMDSDEYLSVDTRSLQQRNIKEVIGLAHFNQAAVFLQQGDYTSALQAYQRAGTYLNNDPLLKGLLGFTYLFAGDTQKGRFLLEEVKDYVPDYALTKDTMAEDYLNGKVDLESLKVIFKHVEHDRDSLLAKKQALEDIVKQHPRFRSGLFHLAIVWMQLFRAGEALNVLHHYVQLSSDEPEIHYYLAALYGQRHDYQKAWEHLRQAEDLVKSKHHDPKDLKELRRSLAHCCPE